MQRFALRRRRGRSRFCEKETADDERVGARAEITAYGVARRKHERLAEQVEGSVEQDGRRRLRAKSFQQAPKSGIGSARDDVEAYQIAWQRVHGKQVAVFGAKAAHRRHEMRRRSKVEIFRRIFLGNGEREGTKRFAMLYIVIQIFLHVGRPG